MKKGKDFLGNLSSPSTVQRSVCPREKFISFIDEAGHLIVKVLSNDLQKTEVDDVQFVRLAYAAPNTPPYKFMQREGSVQ